ATTLGLDGLAGLDEVIPRRERLRHLVRRGWQPRSLEGVGPIEHDASRDVPRHRGHLAARGNRGVELPVDEIVPDLARVVQLGYQVLPRVQDLTDHAGVKADHTR